MSEPVDVLAVIDQLVRNSRALLLITGDPVIPPHIEAGEQARADIAELIAAARKVAAVEHPPVTEENATLLYEIQGLRAALARVGGGA